MNKKDIIFSKSGVNYVIIDPNTGVQIELTRVAAKDAARFFMVELNIVEAYFQENGEKIPIHKVDIKFINMVFQKRGIKCNE